MPRGIGVDLGAVQTDRAKTRDLVLSRDLQYLHKGRGELLAVATAEAGQGVVIRVLVAGDKAERQGVIAGSLDLAA
ncbi:hypothetical protein D3C71_1868940 [compost metagenome]